MNLDTIEGMDDAALLDDPEIAEILVPRRRSRPLRFTQVRKLVETLGMGRTRHTNIETYGGGVWRRWRLRFSLRDGKGGVQRKSIVIENALIADWVREYLAEARKGRSAYRFELREKEYRRRLAPMTAAGRGQSEG